MYQPPHTTKVPERHINLTPTWKPLVAPMLELYRLGGPDDRSFIREQLYNMAIAADLYIALADTPGVIATDKLTSKGLRP